MTQAQHTPGQWFINRESFDCHDGKLSIEVYGDYFIARVDEGVYQEAHARLIAAAPELLSVLKMVQDAAIDMRGEDFNLTTEQCDVFHSAIAKATGSTK